jgi:1-acyl-sn-glycerol-3-phosphate acyltransferase
VPVGIGGSERVMPKKAKFIYPRKVHVEIGPPIPAPTAPAGERVPRTVYKEHSALLHAELQRLFDEAMRHVPWEYPLD